MISSANQPCLVPQSRNGFTPPYCFQAITLIIWLCACVVPFLPFAVSTSPLNAVLFHVPGDQGNWWHFLAGFPFFLAFPLLWLTVQSLIRSERGRGNRNDPAGLRLFAGVAVLSAIGTVLVEVPFMLHLAGTNAWQTFSVLGLGLGILLVSASVLFLRRHSIPLKEWCTGALISAYLANASLCLVVYASSPGDPSTRSGWFITLGLAGPMAIELFWLLARALRGLK